MSVGWINRTPTIFGICPVLELYLLLSSKLLSTAVCRFNGLTLAVNGSTIELALFKYHV